MISDELFYMIKDWHEDHAPILDLAPISRIEAHMVFPLGAYCRCCIVFLRD
jgi:hypothetical protein